ncbi:MAG: winged helix-turn-helix domain-containing protein [Parasphingorhabdus sp.]
MLNKILRMLPFHGSSKIEIDRETQEVLIGGEAHPLQMKTMQVLNRLLEKRSNVVSRRELIDIVWDGNHLVGEKGLNQALWLIRMVLRDDARRPKYIQTIARKGYRWMGPAVHDHNSSDSLRRQYGLVTAAALSMVVLSSNPVVLQSEGEPSRVLSPDGSSSVYRQGRDIVIEDALQRVYVLRPLGRKYFSLPIYSPDGQQLAFTASTDEKCELIVLEFAAGKYEKFTPCPVLGPNRTGI